MDITLGHGEDLTRFSDLALIFKVTVEQNSSNFGVCGGGTSVFSEIRPRGYKTFFMLSSTEHKN